MTSLIMNGPNIEDGHPFGDIHLGGFAIDPYNRPRRVSGRFFFSSPQECWVSIAAQWLKNKGGSLGLIDQDTLTPRVRVGDLEEGVDLWVPIEIYSPVPYREATHWRPVAQFYAEPIRNTPLLDGHEIFIDSKYVPDNGESLVGQPYLDGDQTYGVWEGEPRNSTSIFGVTEPYGAFPTESIVI